MPVSQTLRARMPSENWDDDFLDENDEIGMGKASIVIPKEIQERQASIIGHLGCVREFALLVEGNSSFSTLSLVKLTSAYRTQEFAGSCDHNKYSIRIRV